MLLFWLVLIFDFFVVVAVRSPRAQKKVEKEMKKENSMKEKEKIEKDIPKVTPVKNKAIVPDSVLKGPSLRWEEFGDDQLKNILEKLDKEVEEEVDAIKTKYNKMKQQILEKVSKMEEKRD